MAQSDRQSQIADIIGLIYDSAIDAAHWPGALRGMSGLVDACFASISVIDNASMSVRFHSRWGGDPVWIDLLDKKYAGMMPFLPVLHRFRTGEAFNMAMAAGHLADPDVWNGEFAMDWARPAGIRDAASVILQRSGASFAALSLSTHIGREMVTASELETVAILAPHIRRALKIGDLFSAIDARSETFERMLDSLQFGVVAVDSRGRVCHANRMASEMLSLGDPVSIVDGRLGATMLPASTEGLHAALSRLAAPSSAIPDPPPAIALRFGDGRPAVGHILPLGCDRNAPAQEMGAIAAFIIATPTNRPAVALEILAPLFALTEAETRVMAQIAAGRNRGEAARALSIADSTAKTHLDRIFWKTGVSTQSELVRLLSSLSTPGIQPVS